MIAGLDELSHLVRPEREHDLRVYIVHKAQRQRKLGQFLARLHHKRRVLTASDIVHWQKYTDYGPTIDPKGSKYYDSKSYNGIGAYGKLRNGDAAMNPAWAWSHYHVKPGGTYISDRDGKEHRFQDRTGAKNPQNEDFYHGASAETHVHFHIDAIDGASVHSFLSSHGDSIADTVHRHLSDRLSRQAAV